jgi:hypothetical protein
VPDVRELDRSAMTTDQVIALGRTIGNRALARMLATPSATAAAPRLQRKLDDEVKPSSQIKIWDAKAGEVVTVTFEGYDKLKRVRFRRLPEKGSSGKRKGPPAKAPKPETIDPALAFDVTRKNADIIGEVQQIAEVKDSGVSAGADVIDYVQKLVETATEDEELEVEVLPHRVVTVLSAHEVFKDYLEDLEGLKEVIATDEEYYVGEILDAMKGTGVQRDEPASSSGGGSSSGGNEEWKSERMKKAKAELMLALTGSPGFEKIRDASTLHHKISRSAFGRMMKALSAARSEEAGVPEMWKFVQLAESLTGRHREEALDNWVANIELGVIVNSRAEGDDPGEGFDGSYDAGGTATPRTAALEEAALIIDRIGIAEKPPDWLALSEHLFQAQQMHEKTTKPGALSRPLLSQWTLKDGRYTRNKKGVKATL